MLIFCSIVGVRTDGDCSPSRSVSSSSMTTRRPRRGVDPVPVVNQGIDHEGQTSVLPLRRHVHAAARRRGHRPPATRPGRALEGSAAARTTRGLNAVIE